MLAAQMVLLIIKSKVGKKRALERRLLRSIM
jgi:hypothetical protein